VPKDLSDKISSKRRTLDRKTQRDAKLQIFGLEKVGGTLDSIKNATDSLSTSLPSFTNAAQNVGDMTNHISSMLSSITHYFEETTCKVFDQDIIGKLMNVINIIVNVSFANSESRLKSFFWNVFTSFGKDIYYVMLNACNVGVRAELQANGIISDICSFAKDFLLESSFSLPFMGSLLAILFQICLGLPGKMDFKSAIKFFGDRCKNLKSIFDFTKSYHVMFEGIVSYLMKNIFGVQYVEDGLNDYLSGFREWAVLVLSLNDATEPLAVRLEKDEKLVYKIDNLYRKGMEYASQIGEKRIDSKTSVYFHKLFKVAEEARRLCDFTGVFGNRPRMEPLVIQLFGESGVGKSGMSWPLSVDLNALFVSNIEEAQNFSNNVYFRNTEQEFWDGYVGQNIVTYDDFGQRADSSTAPNEEFMELIRASNIAPYPLHMADLVEKKRTKFNSKVIILTSNILNHNVSSLTFPDAYRRRIDICAQVRNKREYIKSGFSATENVVKERLDTTKCDGPVDTNVYEMILFNAETMTALSPPECLTYDQFLERCLELALAKMRRSKDINTCLTERISSTRFESIRSRLQGVYYDAQTDIVTIEEIDEAIESYRDIITRYIKQFSTFKNLLIMLGVVLAGLGIWKLFSKFSRSRRHTVEASQSGDAVTVKAKRIRVEATKSGDAITNKSKRITVEVTQSGDMNTTKSKVIKVEANQSGDNLTMRGKVIRTEANSSGDNITMRSKKPIFEATLNTSDLEIPTLGSLQAWKDATAQDLISTRIISNLYKIVRVRGGVNMLNGLFVRDTLMLAPRHLNLMLCEDDEIEISNIFGSVFKLPVSDLKFVGISDATGGEKDAMLIQFPRYVNSHCDIVKHFQTMPELSEKSANVALSTIRAVKDKIALVILGNTMAQMKSISLDTEHGIRNIRDCIEYNLNTINGDCGSPIICQEKKFIRKIAGIHIAATPDGTSAFGQSVTQQDLLRTLQYFDKVIINDSDVLANLQIHSETHDLPLNKEIDSGFLKQLFGLAADTFSYLGLCDKTVFTPNKSDLRPSVIQNLVTEITSKPAYLSHPKVDILKKNLSKCGINTPYIPFDEVDRAVNEYKQKLMTNPIEPLRRVLTYEESIGGNDVSAYVAGLTRSTSPGYPWVFNKTSGMPGKTTWFGSSEYVFDEDVKNRVERLEKLAKQGIRVPFVWTDTLKDERRPIAKVNELKTRVFAAGPMDYLILFRMFFLGFMANVMENRITNEQSIGTNPFSSDWTRTAKKLSRFGDKVFAGDFSTFDGTLNSCIMSRFVDVINDWYDDCEENKTLRRTLFLDIYNSNHLCRNIFYSCTHSQPSGNPITTVLNSFYNSVSMRIAFYRCAKKAGVTKVIFDDCVSMVSYGDDNVVNFRSDVVDWFNQNEVTEAYATFGMIYTDEAKSGNIIPFKTLGEVAYLKRSFRYLNGHWFAPLDLSTCLEMCNWIRDCPNHEAATCENIENACRELSIHGKDVFDMWSPKLVSAFYKKTGIYPTVKTYSTYMEDLLEEY